MARSGDGRLALVELKAVDGAYPMLGALTLDPEMPVPICSASTGPAHAE